MIVYIESNFVLELAFLQEQHESCDAVLSLAESGELELVVPAFSLGEPYEAWTRRAKQRTELRQRLTQELRELSRSQPYGEIIRESSEITTLLEKSIEEEKHRLDAALGRILGSAEVISIGAETIRVAVEAQNELGLSPQDSIVYASVLGHLQTSPPSAKCFLNKNSKDFHVSDIEEQLSRHNCRLIPSFEDGLNYIEGQLS